MKPRGGEKGVLHWSHIRSCTDCAIMILYIYETALNWIAIDNHEALNWILYNRIYYGTTLEGIAIDRILRICSQALEHLLHDV